jgi:hypothetical protein
MYQSEKPKLPRKMSKDGYFTSIYAKKKKCVASGYEFLVTTIWKRNSKHPLFYSYMCKMHARTHTDMQKALFLKKH